MIPSINSLPDTVRKLLTVAGITVLASCGGGGGGGFSGSVPASDYIKASNTEQTKNGCLPDVNGCDQFGSAMALSADGDLLIVGAPFEDSADPGIHTIVGDGDGDALVGSNYGAAYVYVRDSDSDSDGVWTFSAYIKASAPGSLDQFGEVLALSDDGSTLAVGVPEEDSNTTIVINGVQSNNDSGSSGAVYVFVRDDTSGVWNQEAYIKSANNTALGRFGWSLALNDDGNTLAVGAAGEERVYIYRRTLSGWNALPDVVQAANADGYGSAVALSDDGDTLAVGAPQESLVALNAGATYVYTYASSSWSQKSYIKASKSDTNFGNAVSLSELGDKLAVGAHYERISTAAEDDKAGAVYVYNLSVGLYSNEVKVVPKDRHGGDEFGGHVVLAGNGSLLFVTASLEDGKDKNLDGYPTNLLSDTKENPTVFNDADSGAAYSFTFDTTSGKPAQKSYIKALNTGGGDKFGEALAVNQDGTVYAIGATLEDSPAIYKPDLIPGDKSEDVKGLHAGAAYLFQ